MTSRFTKDPDATLDYVVDWSAWLTTNETISSVVWDVPTGLTEESAPGGWSEPDGDNSRTVWLSGGTAGTDYIVGCEVTTNESRTDERSIRILCRAR